MIEPSEVRAAVAAVHAELGRLDTRLSEAGELPQLPAADTLTKLEKIRGQVVKLTAWVPRPRPQPEAADANGAGARRG
jgi:hypothetical protein